MDHQHSPDETDVNIHSPGSFMGSSINSHQVSSFELEEASSAGIASKKVNSNWRLGMPWFDGHNSSSRGLDASDVHRYYGGIMKTEDAHIGGTKGRMRSSVRKEKFRGRHHNVTTRASIDEESSIGDFSKSEWTPEDSAYGAACPVCGCIPKRVRRTIEFSLIGFMMLGFVWMVIAASIQVTNARMSESISNSTDASYSSGQMIAVDDDFYVEASNDDLNAAADDGAANYHTYADDWYQETNDHYMNDTYFQYNGNDDDGDRRRRRRRR